MLNNEELHLKMNFIVEQQAQFAADIMQLRESQSHTEKVVAETAVKLQETNEVVTRLANVTHVGFTEFNTKMNAVVDAQIRTEENITRLEGNVTRLEGNISRLGEKVSLQQESISRLDENVARLEKNVSHTSESVRKLKETVETFFKNRRNGN